MRGRRRGVPGQIPVQGVPPRDLCAFPLRGEGLLLRGPVHRQLGGREALDPATPPLRRAPPIRCAVHVVGRARRRSSPATAMLLLAAESETREVPSPLRRAAHAPRLRLDRGLPAMAHRRGRAAAAAAAATTGEERPAEALARSRGLSRPAAADGAAAEAAAAATAAAARRRALGDEALAASPSARWRGAHRRPSSCTILMGRWPAALRLALREAAGEDRHLAHLRGRAAPGQAASEEIRTVAPPAAGSHSELVPNNIVVAAVRVLIGAIYRRRSQT